MSQTSTVYDTIDLLVSSDEELDEETVRNKKQLPSDIDEMGLNIEMKQLIDSESSNWPLEWMNNKSEIKKLKMIMTKKQSSRRHELFMNKRQRRFSFHMTELWILGNPMFMNIFGERAQPIDRDLRIFLRENVFKKAAGEENFDSRLTELLERSSGLVGEYVELVLYPELFVSWVRSKKKCGQEMADMFFQTVGTLVSEYEMDQFKQREFKEIPDNYGENWQADSQDETDQAQQNTIYDQQAEAQDVPYKKRLRLDLQEEFPPDHPDDEERSQRLLKKVRVDLHRLSFILWSPIVKNSAAPN